MIDVKDELRRRCGKIEIRNVKISPLFEKGKRYNLETKQEDPNGHLVPEWNHCWLTWESAWDRDEETVYWSKQAYSFSTIDSAEDAKKFIESIKF